MTVNDDFFASICRDAKHELASGKETWRTINTNTLLLACFGMLSDNLSSKLAKPLWVFASSVAIGLAIYITKQVFHLPL